MLCETLFAAASHVTGRRMLMSLISLSTALPIAVRMSRIKKECLKRFISSSFY